MATTNKDARTPRAVIHKRILDVASERPDASLEAIAEAISGASVDLVEHVLEEYGDPAASPAAEGAGVGADTAADGPEVDAAGPATDPGDPAETDLTAGQLELLRSIAEHPDATQRDLGELLGVSASTVCTRLNAIDGFEWDRRWSFVQTVFGDVGPGTSGDGVPSAGQQATIRALDRRIASLEDRVASMDPGGTAATIDPELAHKVAHACLRSERITEDEELEIIRALLAG